MGVIARFFSSLILVLFSGAAYAQSSSSSISGTVTDATGAVVPGAAITILNEATGVASKQETTGAGVYSIPALSAGTYSVSVEMQGFKSVKKPGNTLVVGTPLTVNFVLEIGSTTETVEVKAQSDALQTGDASVGNVITHEEISEMPLNGRNPLSLLVLEPGVVQRSAGAVGTGIHVNGSRDMSSNTTIDGIEANESAVPNPTNNVFRMSPDNLQEYKVTTSNSTADMGRNSGAIVSMATRQGTNRFHGSVYEYFRNTVLNTNEFFANALGTPKPDIKLNQYGLDFGGPIKRNKTFFFFHWQSEKINFAQPVDQVYSGIPLVYTPEALAGNFRYFKADPRTPFRLNGQTITQNRPALVDPFTGQLSAGVRNCASPTDANCIASFNMFSNDPRRIGADPVLLKMFQAMPAPNNFSAGDALNYAGYEWNPPVKRRGNSFTSRVDHNFNSNNMVFVRYLHGSNNSLGGDPNNSRPIVFPGFPPLGEVYRSSENAVVSYRRVVSSRVFNDLRIGMSRFVSTFTQGEANPAFPDVPAYGRAAGTAFNNIDAPYRNVPRTARAVTTPQILDDLTIIHGAHVIKTGINFRFYEHNDQRGAPGAATVTPTLTFNYSYRNPSGFNTPAVATASVAGINSTDNGHLLGSINDILGIPSRLSQTFLGDLKHDTFLPFRSGNSVSLWALGHRVKQFNSYIQDEWKIRPNLTLNIGLRWEVNKAPTEAAGRVYVANKPISGAEGPVTFVNTDTWFQRNNIGALGPRIGITWAPNRRTVIRTGYSMAFDTIATFQVTAAAGSVPGLTMTCESRPTGAVTPGCGSVPDRRIAEGFPAELPLPSVKPSSFLTPPAQLLANSPDVTVFDPNLKIPTVHQWNFTVQRELPSSIIAQVGYVGRRGTRLFRSYDINQINSDPILPSFLTMQRNVAKGCRADGTTCPTGVSSEPVPIVVSGLVPASFVTSSTTSTDIAQNAAGNFAGRLESNTLNGHLRPNQQFGVITYIDSGGDSYYHSMQSTLRKRFGKGLLLGVTYTFGKSIDDQSVDPVAATSAGGLSTTNARAPRDIRNWRHERARSDFDRTHVFNALWIYELPFGPRHRLGGSLPRPFSSVIGGWTFNGIFVRTSGEPFSLRSGSLNANYSHNSNVDLIGPKPEVKLTDVPGIIGPVYFAGQSSFAQPAPGTLGIGRNVFTAPGYWNMDAGITKEIRITERLHAQLRGEFFNVMNHPNFDNPRDASSGNNNLRSALFGQTCCQTVAPASTQNIVDTGESARVIQIALKLRF